MTLLGAEARPLRGWQQGAALLDWGFALPREASVGQLVAPTGPSPAATAAATGSSPLGGAAPGAGRGSGVGLAGLVGAGLVALLLGVLVAVFARSRTARRRSLR